MINCKMNEALAELCAYSAKLGGSQNAPLTAPRFLLAVLNVLDDTWKPIHSFDEKSVYSTMCVACGVPLTEVKQRLMAYIEKDRNVVAFDDLYMRKRIDAAVKYLQAHEKDILGVEELVLFVLRDPVEKLRMLLGMRSNAHAMPPMSSEEPASDDQLAQEQEAKKDEEAFDTILLNMQQESREPEAKECAMDRVVALTERVKKLQSTLSEKILGQDNAISVFTGGYFRAEMLSMTDKKRERPNATFLFAGPPGVGKTFLAEEAARALELPFMRFDMSEYCDQQAAIEFIGSDGVYKNSKQGNFTAFVGENPRSVVLFDEIEKAHISIIHLFLQILDAGRIRDAKTDQEILLRDVIMIFTTNAGKQLYENSDSGDFSDVSRKVILKALQKDVNPATGNPYFPAAICSRFASGNVVMFNHITAASLCNIAKKEILRHAANFKSEMGVDIAVDDAVFAALLFAEGGKADARTVRARAEAFLDDELFELFRLSSVGAGKIERINIQVDMSGAGDEVRELFTYRDKPEVLIFAGEDTAQKCAQATDLCTFLHADTIEKADRILKERDVRFVLLDHSFGSGSANRYLNIEDEASLGRDFFFRVREYYRDIPVYLLQTGDHVFGTQERISFLRRGVRDILVLAGKKTYSAFRNRIGELLFVLHRQKSMANLASSNKLVAFETAQKLQKGGKNATITLYDFKTALALEADDSSDVLSGVSKPNVRFDAVIGAEDAKEELKYFVNYLKNPKKYIGTGMSAPKGILLYGPPGTGKTMLAKAMACESDVTFIAAEGNQFLKQYVGQGPERVHELFRIARKYAPSILFIDEIDAIAKERTGGENSHGAEATLTAFLTEMDGFKNDIAKPVFVLAATNFSVEPGTAKSLDPALMRRFDRRVYIDLPGRDDRVRYMESKIAGNSVYAISTEQIRNIAIRSTGMSLADLESVFSLAQRLALRAGDVRVNDQVFAEAFETIVGGSEKKWDVSQLERTARHEAGHAVISYLSGDMPSYVTVVARGDHGGYMQHGDAEGKALYTKKELLARIRTSLGGRAAEIMYYGKEDGMSTGASADLAQATSIAEGILCSYGMDGTFGLSTVHRSVRSGELSMVIRTAVNAILDREMENALCLLSENRVLIDRLVQALLERSHLTGEELSALFGKN